MPETWTHRYSAAWYSREALDEAAAAFGPHAVVTVADDGTERCVTFTPPAALDAEARAALTGAFGNFALAATLEMLDADPDHASARK